MYYNTNMLKNIDNDDYNGMLIMMHVYAYLGWGVCFVIYWIDNDGTIMMM